MITVLGTLDPSTTDLPLYSYTVNACWGRGTMRLANVPVDPSWGMRREMMSQSFTTNMNELWTVYCK